MSYRILLYCPSSSSFRVRRLRPRRHSQRDLHVAAASGRSRFGCRGRATALRLLVGAGVVGRRGGEGVGSLWSL